MRSKWNVIGRYGILAVTTLSALPLMAEENAAAFNATTAMTTAMNSASSEIMGMVAVALPIGLSLVASFLAIKKGISFFKSLVNKAS